MNARPLLLATSLLASTLISCERDGASVQTSPGQTPDPRPDLRVFEAERRAQTDFSKLPSSDHVFGADPYAIAPIGDGKRLVSILRGEDALVVLDANAHELARVKTPASPTGLAVSSDRQTVFVSSELGGVVARFAVHEDAPYIQPAGRYELPGVHGLRDVAFGSEGVLYAVNEASGALFSWPHKPRDASGVDVVEPTGMQRVGAGGGPIDVERVGKFVITNYLLDHALSIRPVNEDGTLRSDGEARIVHDGPMWSFSARTDGDALLLLVGGVEDHPLDRRDGFFGYIDSFVFLYRVANGKADRLATVNVSDFGVVTPKAVSLGKTLPDGKPFALVTGYGGESFVRFALGDDGKPPQDVRIGRLPAGSRALAQPATGGFVLANPLLDAFVVLREGDVRDVVHVQPPDDSHRRDLRIGEALFFTMLMAPNNVTEGAHSRFSCETCHFEGYVDGRVHHTGRGDVRVVTKPLLGLFNNRPHFTRALDPDLSAVAHAEFRVAGAGNDSSPWFVLEPAQHPTLSAFDPPLSTSISPIDQRRALMSFLMEFSHRTNPSTQNRSSFSALEKQGAEVFRDRCESCHQARTSTDEPSSRVAFDRWESLIFAPSGSIVWAQSEYRKTGVEPYVHERGARIPSLRRLYKKHPYLTSGAAPQLEQLLARVAWQEDGAFFHDHAPDGAQRLDMQQQMALRAFLELL